LVRSFFFSLSLFFSFFSRTNITKGKWRIQGEGEREGLASSHSPIRPHTQEKERKKKN
jgi:hypothetical protein